jgi:hypothetical protein
MKKLMMFVLATVLVTGATSALALGPLDAEADLPVYSKYVWRGMVNVDDYVLQPAVGLGVFGFHASFWGNVDMTDINTSELADTEWKFTEIDWTLGYTLGLPLFKLGGGFIWYTYPQDTGTETVEFYLGAEASVILNPKLYLYQDLDAYKGAYWDASIGHGFALGETNQLNVTLGVGLGSEGYHDGYFGGGVFIPETDLSANFTDARIVVDLPFHPIPFFTITPSVAWTTLIGDAKKAVEDSEEMLYYGKKDAFFWGLSAKFSF